MNIDEQVEELELHDMSEKEIEKTVKAMSREGLSFRRKRKNVRYRLARLKTESLGGPASEIEKEEEGFKERFEKSVGFGGWKFYGITWDVAMDDPFRVVHKDMSRDDEWNELVRNKFPQIEPGTGRIVYPDIKVRKKVEAEAKLQAKAKPKKSKKKTVKKKTNG